MEKNDKSLNNVKSVCVCARTHTYALVCVSWCSADELSCAWRPGSVMSQSQKPYTSSFEAGSLSLAWKAC